MEDRIRKLTAHNKDLEKKLHAKLALQPPPLLEVTALLKEYRVASEDVTVNDLDKARAEDVETRLWNAHSRINAIHRKQLSKLRKENPKRPVETRKFIKQYLEFLKDSQRFYRELIQKLNASFGPISELRQIAGDTVPLETNTPVSAQSLELRNQTLLSCQQTLVYLGDLSRYRATEKLDRDPAWGPAIGYYNLAAALRPSSGLAFHQQSVIAFEEGDHLRATYYLYRAIVVEEPHPNALANLELEFKKVRKAWDNGELVPRATPQDRNGSRKAMLAWFIRFHSMCFQGFTFSGHDELENEVQSHLASEMNSCASDGTLLKMCFVNFAAQSTAQSRFERQPKQMHMQSYFFFFNLNVKTFGTLLGSLGREVRTVIAQQAGFQGSQDTESLMNKLTATTRYILPAVRMYSTWLLANSQYLAGGIPDEAVTTSIGQFWSTYTHILCLVAAAFPVELLPQVSYLLDEDAESLGFRPLESDKTKKLWLMDHSTDPRPKPVEDTRLQPDIEMLARIRELQIDGLTMAVDQLVPISFDGSQFTYTATDAKTSATTINASTDARNPKTPKNDTETLTKSSRQSRPTQAATIPASADPVVENGVLVDGNNQEAQLNRMVDDLVGPEEDSPAQKRPSSAGLAPLAPAFQPSRSPSVQSFQRLHTVSGLWKDNQLPPRTPSIDAGSRAVRTPPAKSVPHHSRISSAASLRSQNSPQNGFVPSSFMPTPPTNHAALHKAHMAGDDYTSTSGYASGMQSPLLFGAGGGPWSTMTRKSVSSYTPPNGQGG